MVFADQQGLGTIIMEPLKGGRLTNDFPNSAKKELQAISSRRSLADWGLSWLWNRGDVDLVLSGMSDIQQVKENIEIASKAGINMMSQTEINMLDKAKDIYLSLTKVQCTQCRYCVSCPMNIDIYDIFDAYNYAFTVSEEKAKSNYDKLENKVKLCIECGHCEEKCPQDIKIPHMLKEADQCFSCLGQK